MEVHVGVDVIQEEDDKSEEEGEVFHAWEKVRGREEGPVVADACGEGETSWVVDHVHVVDVDELQD